MTERDGQTGIQADLGTQSDKERERDGNGDMKNRGRKTFLLFQVEIQFQKIIKILILKFNYDALFSSLVAEI